MKQRNSYKVDQDVPDGASSLCGEWMTGGRDTKIVSHQYLYNCWQRQNDGGPQTVCRWCLEAVEDEFMVHAPGRKDYLEQLP